MQTPKTVGIDSHAVATLRYIRASMDSAGSMSVPGSTAIAAGSFGLLAALLSATPNLREHWILVWIAAALVTATIGSLLLLRHSPRGAITIAGSPLRKFALSFAPSVAAGAVLTAALWKRGDVDAIPGTWLVLYGCALISGSAVARAQLAVAGSLFGALGIGAFMLPSEWHMALLALGFGGLHLLLGFLIARAEQEQSANEQES